jgi:hypothetical protein
MPPSNEPPAAIVWAAERTDVPEEAGREPPEEPDEEPLVEVAFVVADEPEDAVLDEPDLAVEDALLPEPDFEVVAAASTLVLAESAVLVALEDFLVVVDLVDFWVVVLEAFA